RSPPVLEGPDDGGEERGGVDPECGHCHHAHHRDQAADEGILHQPLTELVLAFAALVALPLVLVHGGHPVSLRRRRAACAGRAPELVHVPDPFAPPAAALAHQVALMRGRRTLFPPLPHLSPSSERYFSGKG